MPYKHILHDVQVSVAIANGKLPRKPEEGPDLAMFDYLWNLCEHCWKERASRPAAQAIVNYLFGELLIRVENQY